MEKQTRSFHISDVLTLATGRMVSTRSWKGLFQILNFMTGDNIMNFQIPRAADICEPVLLRQYPELAEVDASGVNNDNVEEWLAVQIARFGETLSVAAIEVGAFQKGSSPSELIDLMRGDQQDS